MYIPLWKNSDFNQDITSCVLGILPSICVQICAASSLHLRVTHPSWSKRGGFSSRAVAVTVVKVLIQCTKEKCQKNLLILPLTNLAPSLEHESLSSGCPQSKVS